MSTQNIMTKIAWERDNAEKSVFLLDRAATPGTEKGTGTRQTARREAVGLLEKPGLRLRQDEMLCRPFAEPVLSPTARPFAESTLSQRTRPFASLRVTKEGVPCEGLRVTAK
jgi:hypothetical protein